MRDYAPEHYAEVANELIETIPSLKHIKEAGYSICYLVSDKRKKDKGKNVWADCAPVLEANKWAMPFDYLITVYPDGQMLDDKNFKILMHHELLHIGLNGTTVGHDIDEFMEIADMYGLHWAEEAIND